MGRRQICAIQLILYIKWKHLPDFKTTNNIAIIWNHDFKPCTCFYFCVYTVSVIFTLVCQWLTSKNVLYLARFSVSGHTYGITASRLYNQVVCEGTNLSFSQHIFYIVIMMVRGLLVPFLQEKTAACCQRKG